MRDIDLGSGIHAGMESDSVKRLKIALWIVAFSMFVAYPSFFGFAWLGGKARGQSSPMFGHPVDSSAWFIGVFYYLGGFIPVGIAISVYALLVSGVDILRTKLGIRPWLVMCFVAVLSGAIPAFLFLADGVVVFAEEPIAALVATMLVGAFAWRQLNASVRTG